MQNGMPMTIGPPKLSYVHERHCILFQYVKAKVAYYATSQTHSLGGSTCLWLGLCRVLVTTRVANDIKKALTLFLSLCTLKNVLISMPIYRWDPVCEWIFQVTTYNITNAKDFLIISGVDLF